MTHFVFSVLTDDTLTLANSVKEEHDVVFCNDTEKSDKNLMEEVNGLGYSIKADTDIMQVIERLKDSGDPVCVFLMDDEDHNLDLAIRINHSFSHFGNIRVYCRAIQVVSECLIDHMNEDNHRRILHPMVLRRLHPVRNEIFQFLSHNSLFDEAKLIKKEKWVNVVVAGLNDYGKEFFKHVLWCAQAVGYYLRVDVYDDLPNWKDYLMAECPGVFERGDKPRIGEEYFDVNLHENIRIGGMKFYDSIRELPPCSWVIIDTGNESANIGLAIKLRAFLSGKSMEQDTYAGHGSMERQSPRILAVVQDDLKAKMIDHNALFNYKGQYYQIECIGRNSNVYDYGQLVDSELEKEGLVRHLSFMPAESFETCEYYRRSSMASAIYSKMHRNMEVNEEQLAITEHRRWCAYMRAVEGFSYGTARDDLAKRHPSLTAYDNLGQIEKAKDLHVIGVKKEES